LLIHPAHFVTMLTNQLARFLFVKKKVPRFAINPPKLSGPISSSISTFFTSTTSGNASRRTRKDSNPTRPTFSWQSRHAKRFPHLKKKEPKSKTRPPKTHGTDSREIQYPIAAQSNVRRGERDEPGCGSRKSRIGMDRLPYALVPPGDHGQRRMGKERTAHVSIRFTRARPPYLNSPGLPLHFQHQISSSILFLPSFPNDRHHLVPR
jgi:hypothetical protein